MRCQHHTPADQLPASDPTFGILETPDAVGHILVVVAGVERTDDVVRCRPGTVDGWVELATGNICDAPTGCGNLAVEYLTGEVRIVTREAGDTDAAAIADAAPAADVDADSGHAGGDYDA